MRSGAIPQPDESKKLSFDIDRLLAEVCKCYGWTVDQALSMRSVQFFRMLEEARRITAQDWLRRCRVQAISIYNSEYFKETLEHFEAGIPVTADEMLRKMEEEERLTVSGPEARAALTSIFGGRLG